MGKAEIHTIFQHYFICTEQINIKHSRILEVLLSFKELSKYSQNSGMLGSQNNTLTKIAFRQEFMQENGCKNAFKVMTKN